MTGFRLAGLFHPLPGRGHAAARQFVMLACKFLLGGERFKARASHAAQVQSRVKAFMSDIRGRAALCVSHGVVIQTFLSVVQGTVNPVDHVPCNGSLHLLALDPVDE